MTPRPVIVVWLREDTWRSTVRAAAAVTPDADLVLLHVVDVRVTEALHGAYGGLLGRGQRRRDPGEAVGQLAADAGRELLAAAAVALGRPARRDLRAGHIEREVVAACEGAALLVCARDGDRSRLGPNSLGRHTRFVIDHAPCTVLLIWPEDVPGLASIRPPPQRPPGHQPS
ncbi:MAG: universal stress protein [Pseudonocardiaceae bacterium]